MSTSVDRDAALAYANRDQSKPGLLFEISMGMVGSARMEATPS